jgi:hypothetical protein
MKQYRSGGLGAAIAGAAMLLSLGATSAHAQSGSYLASCNNVQTFGDRLIADCRRMDGSWGRTALHDLGSCVGDIGNMNGQLTCNRGGSAYGSSYPQRGGSPYYGR